MIEKDMDEATANQQKRMSELQEELRNIQNDRVNGVPDYSIDQVERILTKVIETIR